MTLLAKAQWKTALDKEVASYTNINVYTLLLATSAPSGSNVIGS